MTLAKETEREKDAPKAREAIYLLLDLVRNYISVPSMFFRIHVHVHNPTCITFAACDFHVRDSNNVLPFTS